MNSTDVIDDLTVQFLHDLRAHPFIKKCRAGKASKEEMTAFLVQHAKYGRHFTRLLCGLIANLRSETDVLALVENLADETGLTSDSKPHTVIYREMLHGFSIDEKDHPINEETQFLIDEMYRLTGSKDPAYGLGALCLGAEAIVPHLYSDLITAFRAIGVPDNEIIFFHLHVECDDAHALTMRRIMENMIESDENSLQKICDAARQSINARLKFFDGIQQQINAALAA